MAIESALHHFDIKTEDGLCDVAVARPKPAGLYPGVLMMMDAFGPREYMFEMAQKLAAGGYIVLLPNLFYRAKRAPLVEAQFPVKREDFSSVIVQVMPIARSYETDRGLKDIGVLLDWLKVQEGSNGKIGITGYCFGGGVALRAAAAFPDQVSAVASFHAGRLGTTAPDSPHRLFGAIKAEIYIAHADNDPSMPAEEIVFVQKALEDSGAKFEVETYTGAAHGFTMADMPAYNAEALAHHWQKLDALFVRNLKT
jgi:carboxymethylenebutenolidase